MPSKTKTQDTFPKEDDKKQSERFREAARNLEADKDSKKFDEAFKKIVPPKKAGR